MAQLPQDIEKLSQMYIAGESNDDLSAQAIVVIVRIRNERAFAQARADMSRLLSLQEELASLKVVLKKIAGRSDKTDVLARFHEFLAQQKITL